MFQLRAADGRLITVDAAPGRHALEFLTSTTAPAGAAPDVVIVPVHKLASALAEFQALPDTLFDPVRAGRARLVLDSSCEGIPADEALADGGVWRIALHQELQRRGIDSGGVAYLTQDRSFAERYTARTLAAGLAPMSVHIHDYYIRALFKPFETSGEAELAQRLAEYRARPMQRSRRFVCLNFTVREAKLLLLLRLIREGLWDEGHISFSGFDRTVNPRAVSRKNAERWIRAFPGFEDLAAELLPSMDALQAKGMVMLGRVHRSDNTGRFKGMTDEKRILEYNDAWFTVTTETELWGPHRITEKPFKAMLSFSPSITLGSPGNLRLTRSFGFRTFPELVDETYDEIADPRARFEAVWREIDRLCRMPEAELARLEALTHETLEHNARRAFLEMPGEYRAIDDRLLMTLAPPPVVEPRSGRFSLRRIFARQS